MTEDQLEQETSGRLTEVVRTICNIAIEAHCTPRISYPSGGTFLLQQDCVYLIFQL